MTYDEIRKIALSYPGVYEHPAFGSGTFKVGKRLLSTPAKIDPNTLVLKCPDPLERDYFLTTQPDVYYMADHYLSFECLLVRYLVVNPAEYRDLFEQAWQFYAPKKVVASYNQPRE